MNLPEHGLADKVKESTLSKHPFKVKIEVARAVILAPAKLPSAWQFEWTEGYGAWAQGQGKWSKMPSIPWNASLQIHLEGESVQSGICSSKITSPPGGSDSFSPRMQGKMGLVTWTKHQWLDVGKGTEVEFKTFSWKQPCEYLCAFNAIFLANFYSQTQIEFLANYFDPAEWAGKGMLVDDQAFFDFQSGAKMQVYHGYWKYMMARWLDRLIEEGYLIFETLSEIGEITLQSPGSLTVDEQKQLIQKFRIFLSTELVFGIYKAVPRNVASRIHDSLPSGLRAWLTRRR